MTHVDDFIDSYGEHNYARWFFSLHRLPAVLKMDFAEQLAQYKLFCTYQGVDYRVTGCSRMGDVWLAVNFDQDTGYDLRVDVAECTNFVDNPKCFASYRESTSV